MSKKDTASYTCFIPVYGMTISPKIGGELKLQRAIFVRADAIARRRKRYGLFEPISSYKIYKGFSKAETYAVVRNRRLINSNNFDDEIRLVYEDLMLFASSIHVVDTRGRYEIDVVPGIKDGMFENAIAFRQNSGAYLHSHHRFAAVSNFVVDKLWKKNAKQEGFDVFINSLREKSSKWLNALRRSAILAGESFLSRSLMQAFIINMIAIECILFEQGDKYSREFPRRLGSLFGWVRTRGTSENLTQWKNLAERLYSLRCSVVHDGKSGELTIQDLLDSDLILHNLHSNLWRNLKRFNSKGQFLDFLDCVEARRKLGLRTRRKSDKLSFWSMRRNKRQMEVLANHFRVGEDKIYKIPDGSKR